jgi:preprotein translocase subunit YajC
MEEIELQIAQMTPLEWLGDFGMSIIPPVLMGLLFYVVMRGIFRADSKERKVYAQIEAEERAKREKASNA